MTSITNKKLATIIMSTTILLAGLNAVPSAFAHPIYTGHSHFWGSTDVCYDTTGLNALTVNGSTGNSATVATELDNARGDWNDESSSFSFNYQSSCSHWVSSTSLSGGTVAQTTTTYDGFGYVYDVDFNFDSSSRTWTSGTSCDPDSEPASLRYAATHEFGHWLEFGHASDGTSSHSVMWTSYNCNGINVKSADATELDSVY